MTSTSLSSTIVTLAFLFLSQGNFFAHESYYLPGLSKFLLENSQEELKHAQKVGGDFSISRDFSFTKELLLIPWTLASKDISEKLFGQKLDCNE